ncbi:MAG: uracil-DNA glycosylase [Clostridia bacterium]|nr:uracil-DNA glycosylase [Clostridia bacterium]
MAGWIELINEINACEGCELCRRRTYAVVGEGNPDAELMFIGEGPGEDEDRLARPFVGASGQLLTAMIEAIGLRRRDVYIANIVKCRPPGNRTPSPQEAEACLGFLRRQVQLVRPEIIVLLGATAAKYTIGQDVRIRRDHGTWSRRAGVDMMPTFHPSALLRDESQKADAWRDFLSVKKRLDEVTNGKYGG